MTAVEMGREMPTQERAQPAFPCGAAKITVCSWCQSVVRVEPDASRKHSYLTHGIGVCCRGKFLAGFAKETA
jgi:hypothetical protein